MAATVQGLSGAIMSVRSVVNLNVMLVVSNVKLCITSVDPKVETLSLKILRCAKWRTKLNPEKTKVIIFSKFQTAIRAEPALSLYGELLSYYPHIKFLGITFRMTIG